MYVPEYIIKSVSLLEKAGFEAYAVGGCVRDSLLGQTPNDWDMTTNAHAQEIEEVFSEYKVIETGIKHGTVTVLFEGIAVEITTYRIDGKYSDNRHPDDVLFSSSLTDDLARRDFTVNAMAYNPDMGIVDPYGGADDIKSGVIRCVGQPDRRFVEDALRILRALRFSSVLGFTIDVETANSIHKNKGLLNNISPERVYAELKKILLGKNVYNVLTEFADVFFVIFPELSPQLNYNQNNFHHIYTLWEHTCLAVASACNDVSVRLCMLFHDSGKPVCRSDDENGVSHYYAHSKISCEIAKKIFKRLKSDSKTTDEVLTLIEHHDTPLSTDTSIIKRRLRRFGEPLLIKLIEVHRADTLALSPKFIPERLTEFEAITHEVEKIIEKESCFCLKDLAVNGYDLQQLGLSGKEIGFALEKTLEAVIDGKLPNEKSALLRYISSPNKNFGSFFV